MATQAAAGSRSEIDMSPSPTGPGTLWGADGGAGRMAYSAGCPTNPAANPYSLYSWKLSEPGAWQRLSNRR